MCPVCTNVSPLEDESTAAHPVLPPAVGTDAHYVLDLKCIPLPSEENLAPPVSTPFTTQIAEAPPSSDDNEDDPEHRVAGDSRFLNGSSSNLLAKSAPSTPHGEDLQVEAAFPASGGPISRSSSHVFNRHDKQALKQLSVSAPVMTQARPQPPGDPLVTPEGPPSPEQQTGSSKSRQKKFHRHFKQVAAEEHVLNYYSCALVGDILLQGHLYITKNYFGFYSNVFGYVTKILIPTVSVLKISKEKTARIIPNAVGVVTEDDKHVFCSLLSRDSTYRLMVDVWKTAQNALPNPKELKPEAYSASGDIHPNDDDSSSEIESEPFCPQAPADSHTDVSHSETGCVSKPPNGEIGVPQKPKCTTRGSTVLSSLPRPKLILTVSACLLVLLFLSAAFLLYRIGRIHNQFSENPIHTGSDEVYQEILKWQTQLHSKSANEVQEFLSANLDQLAKVRQSLEVLSMLIITDDGNTNKSPAASDQSSQPPNLHHRQQSAPALPQQKHS